MGTASVGLVLAGGGAKGAYQAGALAYLAECGFAPCMIAGSSIGALNGAILASHADFKEGATMVAECWNEVGGCRILSPNPALAVNALEAVLPYTIAEWLNSFLLSNELIDSTALFDPMPIDSLLRRFVDPDALRSGTELWVTVFPAIEIPFLKYTWLLDFVRARCGTAAEWISAQHLAEKPTELYRLLLASAAIPLAFPQQTVGGRSFRDGGLADNIPLGALARRGCSHVIVIHLDEGTIFSAQEFPKQTIIEIRPSISISRSDVPLLGALDTLLDFSPQRIGYLQSAGYSDAKKCLERYSSTLSITREWRKGLSLVIDSTNSLMGDGDLECCSSSDDKDLDQFTEK